MFSSLSVGKGRGGASEGERKSVKMKEQEEIPHGGASKNISAPEYCFSCIRRVFIVFIFDLFLVQYRKL